MTDRKPADPPPWPPARVYLLDFMWLFYAHGVLGALTGPGRLIVPVVFTIAVILLFSAIAAAFVEWRSTRDWD